jgi:hypothetical protein
MKALLAVLYLRPVPLSEGNVFPLGGPRGPLYLRTVLRIELTMANRAIAEGPIVVRVFLEQHLRAFGPANCCRGC